MILKTHIKSKEVWMLLNRYRLNYSRKLQGDLFREPFRFPLSIMGDIEVQYLLDIGFTKCDTDISVSICVKLHDDMMRSY